MLKRRIADFIKRNKKETVAVALGVFLLGGIGLGYAYISNSSVPDSSVVVEDVEVSSDLEEDTHVHGEDCNHDHEDEGVSEGEDNTEVATDDTVSTEEVSSTEDSTDNEESDSSSTSDNSSSSNKDTTTSSSSSNKNDTSTSSSSSTSNKNNTTSSSSNSSSSSSSSSGGNSSSHTHNWVAVTETFEHVEEGHWENVLVKDAWVEEVPVYEEKELSICNGCGKDITSDPWGHIEEQMLAGNTKCGGYHSEWKQVQTGTNKITHDAIYEKKWVVTKEAWTETVTTGHKCSGCGATK